MPNGGYHDDKNNDENNFFDQPPLEDSAVRFGSGYVTHVFSVFCFFISWQSQSCLLLLSANRQCWRRTRSGCAAFMNRASVACGDSTSFVFLFCRLQAHVMKDGVGTQSQPQ